MRRVRVIACALVAILSAALAAPARAETVVRWATPEPPLTWDPHGSDFLHSVIGYRLVYEGLTRAGPDGRPEPALATSWKLVDPTTWRFELRQGVHFHDGSPLTAEDVTFSLDRARGEGSQVKSRAPPWSGRGGRPFDRRDRTKRPDLLLPVRLRGMFVMSRAWAEAHGVAAATPHVKDRGTYARDHAMGTGPFRLAEHIPGGRTVLERSPDWWDAGQHPDEVDRVVWTAIPDGVERAAALLRDEVDFVQGLPPDAVGEVRATPGLKVAEIPALRVFWLTLPQASRSCRARM